MILFYVILLVSSYFLNFERKGEVSFHRQKETQKVLFSLIFLRSGRGMWNKFLSQLTKTRILLMVISFKQ